MKILAFADVHDRFERVTRVLEKVGAVDWVVIAGDITNDGNLARVQEAFGLWRPLAPQLLAVSGNMDSPAVDQSLEEMGVSINGRCHRAGQTAFFGCSAAPEAIGTPYEIPEREIARRIEEGYRQAGDASCLVFVPHAPPYGALDQTHSGIAAGSRAVRDFVNRVQPALVICGHIHEARGQTHLGRSLVVNCGPAARGHHALITVTAEDCQAELY